MANVKQKKSRDEVVFTWPIVLLLVGSIGIMVGSFAMKPPVQSDNYMDGVAPAAAYAPAATTGDSGAVAVMGSTPAGGPPRAAAVDVVR